MTSLTDLSRHYLDFADIPDSGGERLHPTIHVDLRSLQGQPGCLCETDRGQVIPPATARQYACDASISRVITDGRSEPLDVGRRTRTVPAGLRRAVVARDRHCRWPGCDRPRHWCDIHHVDHWLDGGETKLDKLVLLCRRHHTLTHRGYTLSGTATNLTITRPDGTILLGPDPP